METRKRFILRESIIFIVLTLFFTGVVFLLRSYFFTEPFDHVHNHETTIEKTWWENEIFEPSENISSILEEHFNSASPYNFYYFPTDFEDLWQVYAQVFTNFLESEYVKKSVFGLHIQMHQKKYDVRWKMKNKSVKMYGVTDLSKNEFLSVAIHEFAHFVDIYYFQKKVLHDISENFYLISWEETRIIKSWQEQKDFVSWYAMTNKYEDFAESFTYYILHNKDFLEKAQKSEILQKKYNFFSVYFFKKWGFQETDFSIDNIVLDYYRDITKIEYDLEKLLQYLKKWI